MWRTILAKRVRESLSELNPTYQKDTCFILKRMGKHFRQKSKHKGLHANLSRMRGESGWSTVDEEEGGAERREMSKDQIIHGISGYENEFGFSFTQPLLLTNSGTKAQR